MIDQVAGITFVLVGGALMLFILWGLAKAIRVAWHDPLNHKPGTARDRQLDYHIRRIDEQNTNCVHTGAIRLDRRSQQTEWGYQIGWVLYCMACGGYDHMPKTWLFSHPGVQRMDIDPQGPTTAIPRRGRGVFDTGRGPILA